MCSRNICTWYNILLCMFGAFSDIPSTQSTPTKPKRKGSALGLDPQDLAIQSPRKRSCKKSSPLPAPAKQVQRCVKEHFFISFSFLFGVLVFPFLGIFCLFVHACMHSPELELMPCTHFDLSQEDWSCAITYVHLGWRMEKCSRFS